MNSLKAKTEIRYISSKKKIHLKKTREIERDEKKKTIRTKIAI